jgi:beta-alanine--pyruvate transaminase
MRENDPLAAFWMPFTANRAYKSHPRQLVAAKDMHYTDAAGNRILDGTSGLWCSNAGHCRTPIVEAIHADRRQHGFRSDLSAWPPACL